MASTRVLVVLGGVLMAAFQGALAAGMAWGERAYGPDHAGVLPQRLRLISLGAWTLWVVVALFVARIHLPARHLSRIGLIALAIGLSLAAGLNLISAGTWPKLVWAPLLAAMALGCWLLLWWGRPGQSRAGVTHES